MSRPLLHRYRTHFVLWYPIRSHTFKNRIRSPLAVNIGTEKSSVIGGCTSGREPRRLRGLGDSATGSDAGDEAGGGAAST